MRGVDLNAHLLSHLVRWSHCTGKQEKVDHEDLRVTRTGVMKVKCQAWHERRVKMATRTSLWDHVSIGTVKVTDAMQARLPRRRQIDQERGLANHWSHGPEVDLVFTWSRVSAIIGFRERGFLLQGRMRRC